MSTLYIYNTLTKSNLEKHPDLFGLFFQVEKNATFPYIIVS